MSRVSALLLDAFGTIVELEPPAPRLVRGLREQCGIEISPNAAEHALKAEITYYRLHHLEGHDDESLADLRLRCAEVLHEALPAPAGRRLDAAGLLPVMMDSLRFRRFSDVVPALRRFRGEGLRVAVVSNWDVSLGEVIGRCGLDSLVDFVVSSATVARAKPDPAPFLRALELLGAEPEEAVHIGDEPRSDVAGALAAGISPVLIRRGPGRAETNREAGPDREQLTRPPVAGGDRGGHDESDRPRIAEWPGLRPDGVPVITTLADYSVSG